eukprot:scaffold28025_cov76-Amphora_coffeaeformis.AAC.1
MVVAVVEVPGPKHARFRKIAYFRRLDICPTTDVAVDTGDGSLGMKKERPQNSSQFVFSSSSSNNNKQDWLGGVVGKEIIVGSQAGAVR